MFLAGCVTRVCSRGCSTAHMLFAAESPDKACAKSSVLEAGLLTLLRACLRVAFAKTVLVGEV